MRQTPQFSLHPPLRCWTPCRESTPTLRLRPVEFLASSLVSTTLHLGKILFKRQLLIFTTHQLSRKWQQMLARMRGKWNPCSMLVGLQMDAAIIEIRVVNFLKGQNQIYHMIQLRCSWACAGRADILLHIYLLSCVYCWSIFGREEMQTT